MWWLVLSAFMLCITGGWEKMEWWLWSWIWARSMTEWNEFIWEGLWPKWDSPICGSTLLWGVESVSYAVVLNGHPHQMFTPNRGIRQGDPLSPFLFIICAEGLSTLLNKRSSKGDFAGLRINRYCPTITHLFFADDSLLFFRAKVEEAEVIKSILLLYKNAFGQLVNFSKSVLVCSQNSLLNIVNTICGILNVEVHESLGNYLGLPSKNNKNKALFFEDIKNKVWKTVQGWKSIFGGRKRGFN